MKNNAFKPSDVSKFINILEGVNTLIKHKQIHFDIKLENILITNDNDYKIILIDFGTMTKFDNIYVNTEKSNERDIDELYDNLEEQNTRDIDWFLNDYPTYLPEFKNAKLMKSLKTRETTDWVSIHNISINSDQFTALQAIDNNKTYAIELQAFKNRIESEFKSKTFNVENVNKLFGLHFIDRIDIFSIGMTLLFFFNNNNTFDPTEKIRFLNI